MKKKDRILIWIGVLFLLPMLLTSCDKQDDPGKKANGSVSFTFNSDENSSGGRVNSPVTPAFVKYLVENSSGQQMSETVPLLAFGEGYISDRQTFSTGDYKLLEYFILDSENSIIYAAVQEGAPLANLVEYTLPLNFTVDSQEVTLVSPDVLPVSNESSPSDFGYVKWSFNVAAQFVKFILPVHEVLIPNFRSATLTITQGNYVHSQELIGSPSTGLYANILVKPNKEITISMDVVADDVLISNYNLISNDFVDHRESISKMHFTQTLPSLNVSAFTFPVFKHKIGKGWSFGSAEIKAVGLDGTWVKVRYESDVVTNMIVPFTYSTSANGEIAFYNTDKFFWSKPSIYYNPSTGTWVVHDPASFMVGLAGPSYSVPVCDQGVCSVTANFSGAPKYAEYMSHAEADDWVTCDALSRFTVRDENNVGHYLDLYFKIEKDVLNSWPDADGIIKPDKSIQAGS